MTINANDALSSARKRRIQKAVLGWYGLHGRKLPWRESADPYRVWLSEVMLQQTTVAAVVPYFERFTAAFPDVESLAAAEIDEVLKLWEGLGYYSRARNLHKAAQVVVSEYSGKFPDDVSTLRELPGIGRYTAGAIASFAFDKPAAIVEANTERLYARLIALREDVRSTSSQKTLWEFAESIVPSERPGDFNQALMDIGSKICRPQDPDCDQCPLQPCCHSFEQGLQGTVPVRKPRVPITAVSELGVVLQHRGKFLLRRRTETERWAGMWDFVRFEIDDAEAASLPFTQTLSARSTSLRANSNGKKNDDVPGGKKRRRTQSLFSPAGETFSESLTARIAESSGALPRQVLASMEFSYSVTRYKVRLFCFLCKAETPKLREDHEQNWFSIEKLGELPLSTTGRQIAVWLEQL